MYENVMPTSLHIEASAKCQLACPLCPTASGATRAVLGAGYLNVRDFEQLLNDNSAITDVELSNYGEMFLNPYLREILRVASERQVVLHADGGVNFNHAKTDVLEGLVRYGFRSITCSIDGASQDVYKIYRVRGNFDLVIHNIRELNSYKKQYRSALPILSWQFVIFGHNEHEIEAARGLASELDMKFYVKLNWDSTYSQVRDAEFVRRVTGLSAVNRSEFSREHGVDYARRICHQLWRSPVINWDGTLVGCCRNFWGDFGPNVFRQGLVASIGSEKISYARRMLKGEVPPRQDIPCVKCDLFSRMTSTGRWISDNELGDALSPGDIMLSIVVLDRSSRDHQLNVFLLPGEVPPPGPVVSGMRPLASLRLGEDHCVLGVQEAGEYVICLLPDGESVGGSSKHEMKWTPIIVRPRPVCQEYLVSFAECSSA